MSHFSPPKWINSLFRFSPNNTAFTFQLLLNILGWGGISKTLLDYDPSTFGYTLRTPNFISLSVFIILKINYTVKMVYLVFLLSGLIPVEGFGFLDNLTVGFWVLVFGLIVIGESFWCRRYPFFEILSAGWKLQNEVHRRLKRQDVFRESFQYSVVKKALFQSTIMGIGTVAMGVQYSSAPKYPVFTGYIVAEDSPLMTILFGLHEVGFLYTAWCFYGPIICLSSILGKQISLLLEFMEEELEYIVGGFCGRYGGTGHFKNTVVISMSPENDRVTLRRGKMNHQNSSGVDYDCDVENNNVPNANTNNFYTLQTLIFDYRKLSLYVERLNEFCSYKFLFVHITAYIQMTGDVFIMIQLLRSGGQFWDVFFYLEDCCVCMYMLFKCFKAMSLVQPVTLKLLRGLAASPTSVSPYYRSLLRTLKPVILKIGPNFVVPETVGNSIMVLLTYYITAALW